MIFLNGLNNEVFIHNSLNFDPSHKSAPTQLLHTEPLILGNVALYLAQTAKAVPYYMWKLR